MKNFTFHHLIFNLNRSTERKSIGVNVRNLSELNRKIKKDQIFNCTLE